MIPDQRSPTSDRALIDRFVTDMRLAQIRYRGLDLEKEQARIAKALFLSTQ